MMMQSSPNHRVMGMQFMAMRPPADNESSMAVASEKKEKSNAPHCSSGALQVTVVLPLKCSVSMTE
jgi:hypothetical protein